MTTEDIVMKMAGDLDLVHYLDPDDLLESLDYILEKEIDLCIKLNKDPDDRYIDAKEWTEWHLEPWSRMDRPEPIPTWVE